MKTESKILIVDDDTAILELLGQGLTEEGFQVQTCQDGGQAAYLIRHSTYQGIILDIRLPSMNGLQVASIARSGRTNRKTPLIIISGVLDQSAADRAQKLGVAEIIEKPFDAKTVISRIKEIIEKANEKISYDATVINTFIEAASEVFEFYFKEKPKRGKAGVKAPGSPARGSVTGLISFTGNGFVGSMALSVNVPFIKGIASSVFPEAEIKLDKELAADLIGEMANQVLGAVKIRFASLGIKITLGLPEVVIGKNHIIIHKVKNPVLFVPIGKDNMGCDLEFCLDKTTLQTSEESAEEHQEGGSVLLFE